VTTRRLAGRHADRLARLRARIERTDDQIVALLARRAAIAARIGAAKAAAGAAIHDPAREAQVVRRAGSRAREAGLPAEDVRALFWRIIGVCRAAQRRPAKP